MTQCCGTWNTDCCPQHHPITVTFENLRTKYSINEDICIDYTLHGHVAQASTRDWIGIFPRGWMNLQHYLTFEYALVAPRAVSLPKRTILFPRVFHQEATLNTDYQLVYISKEIQVLAVSSYFRFFREEDVNEAKHALHVPEYAISNSILDKRETYADQPDAYGWAPPPKIVLSDQSLLSVRPSKSIPSNPRFPRTCKSCGRPREKISGNGIGRTRFLATHNASLAERVARLERDLALAEGTKCSIAAKLRAYESFVGEMLKSLATKRTVKITDASGKEILIQRLAKAEDEQQPVVSTLETANHPEEENHRPAIEQNRKDSQCPTNDRASFGDYVSEEKLLPTKNEQEVPGTESGVVDGFVSEKTQIVADVETQTHHIWNTTRSSFEDHAALKTDNDEDFHKDTVLEPLEVAEKLGEELQNEIETENKITTLAINDETKTPQSKPSAIVIQGSNVKFAIIRY
ncbi:uncharacterized protein LOC125501331 isoform X2 [Athalia rosae]|uniref:uncharacterized protein LOC125501331 isoform X2 n=1 Tax=Athalia rosae TaxID=37344 RepID=UPI002033FD04|nr:uncharacterized protein LOC125501331 isoform X2 [Athalia rosae]